MRRIHDVNDLKMIEVSFNIFNDQQKWEASNGHMFQVADRIHDVTGSNKKARYYRQATLNGNNCDCRISFGGDDKWKKATCPRAANAHLHGQIFENCLMKNMKKNHEDLFPQETALPHWLKSGTFHVLFNEYNHLEGNSIDFHDDEGETYSFLDPICSFTFKSPGILLVKRKSGSKGKSEKNEASILLLFQNPGDCVVMSGYFQQFYQHAVPARNKWADIRERREYEGVPICSDDEHWTQFCEFLDHLQKDSESANTTLAWRWNCTLRWHRNHIGGCRYAVRNQPPESMPARQPGPGPSLTIKMPSVTPWSTHPQVLNFAGGVQPVRPGAVTVILPQGMALMGPIGQAAATCVSDSALVSDDRPGRLIQSATCVSDSASVSDDRPAGLSQSAPCVSDSASVSDDRPGELTQSLRRGTKRTQAKPESADSLPAGKKIKMAKIVSMYVDRLGPKLTADLLKCWSFFPSPYLRNHQVEFLKKMLSDILETEATIREALCEGVDLSPLSLSLSPADPMPSDKWLTSLSKSKSVIDLKLSLLTQQKLLEEFLNDYQWVNACIQRSQVNVLQTRKHLRRCPVKGQDFVDWFQQQRNSFDTGALKEFGWLKMNAFIDDCLHVVPSGKQYPFKEYFNGAVVLETIDFSVSDLRKDDPIQHGLLQVTVMPSPLQTVCKQLSDEQVAQFADRIGYMLQSLVFFIEASSEENECFLNLWVADYEKKTEYSRKKQNKW